jgi:hypothetical protein
VEAGWELGCIQVWADKTSEMTCFPPVEPPPKPPLLRLQQPLLRRTMPLVTLSSPTPPHLPGGGVFYGHPLYQRRLITSIIRHRMRWKAGLSLELINRRWYETTKLDRVRRNLGTSTAFDLSGTWQAPAPLMGYFRYSGTHYL